MGTSPKKLKIINSESNPESDQESETEEPPINIPDLPKLENDDAFTTLRNNTRDLDWKDTHLSYQRDHQPSRQALWRQKQRKNELQTAQSFNRGKYVSESLVTWEQMWIHGKGIPEGRTGCHTKISSLFNDEEVQLFVREFISTKKEEITAPLLARAVTEFIGLKEIGDRVQASLEMAEQRGGREE